jgi:hypothetical protein
VIHGIFRRSNLRDARSVNVNSRPCWRVVVLYFGLSAVARVGDTLSLCLGALLTFQLYLVCSSGLCGKPFRSVVEKMARWQAASFCIVYVGQHLLRVGSRHCGGSLPC